MLILRAVSIQELIQCLNRSLTKKVHDFKVQFNNLIIEFKLNVLIICIANIIIIFIGIIPSLPNYNIILLNEWRKLLLASYSVKWISSSLLNVKMFGYDPY